MELINLKCSHFMGSNDPKAHWYESPEEGSL